MPINPADISGTLITDSPTVHPHPGSQIRTKSAVYSAGLEAAATAQAQATQIANAAARIAKHASRSAQPTNVSSGLVHDPVVGT